MGREWSGRCWPAGVVVLTLLAGLVGCGSIRWETDYETALQRAAQQRRRALVQFYSFSSSECRTMDRDVFSDPQVQRHMREYVAVRLDLLLNRKLAERFNVQVLPTFFVVRPDWQVAGSHAGPMTAEEFGYFLIKYRHN